MNVSAVLVAICLIGSLAIPIAAGANTANHTEQQVVSFERHNPAYSAVVPQGTSPDELGLPATVRVVLPLAEGQVDEQFCQSQPQADMSDGYAQFDYFHYGYVAPADAEELYATGQRVVYTIYYADPDGDVVERAWRLYGSIAGGQDSWYACDADGVLIGRVLDAAVTWRDNGYDGTTPGLYSFTATMDDYGSDGLAQPTAQIRVEDSQAVAAALQADDGCGEEHAAGHTHADTADNAGDAGDEDGENVESGEDGENGESFSPASSESAESDAPAAVAAAEDCHCGLDGGPIDADNFPWAHQEDCPYFAPVECLCQDAESGEYTHVHDATNKDCPLYGKDTVQIVKSDGSPSVVANADVDFFCQHGAIIAGAVQKGQTALSAGRLLRSINGGGTNDSAGDTMMALHTPTSGNAEICINEGGPDDDFPDIIHVPGIWVDYINTMWMNTGYTSFAWQTDAQVGAYNNWKWSGAVASQTTGTVQTNALRQPAVQNKIWTVYSGEQLRYALTKFTNGQYIQLAAPINLNGNQYNWETIDCKGKGLRMNGGKICNLGITSTGQASDRLGLFAKNYYSLELKELNFENAKIVDYHYDVAADTGKVSVSRYTGILYHGGWDYGSRAITNVEIKDSLFYGFDLVSPLGGVGTGTALNNCFATGNYIYGRNHMGGLCTDINRGTDSSAHTTHGGADYCAAWNNLLCGTGGHSSGFIPCYSSETDHIRNCFTSVELYGSRFVGGFTTIIGGEISNCFATGKIEGYSEIGGFLATTGQFQQNISNCYSTALVGLRSPAQRQGGFVAPYTNSKMLSDSLHIGNCYAAGEVGNFDTDLDDPQDVGGFISVSDTSIMKCLDAAALNHCYYDKQTTAMREWTAGDARSLAGITGVLTSSCDKAGVGLASGGYGGSNDAGFSGFTDNSQWVYTAQHYPQLAVFANASAADWGSDARVASVQANSLASAATVFLDTWNSGYDWDDNGVRSLTENSYNRTLASTGKSDHKGNLLTYDTVREIVTDAPVTNTASWEQLIPGGAPVDENSDGVADARAMDVSAADGIQVLNPGMDWYRIREYSGSTSGSRPIRLIAFQRIEAGPDVTVAGGELYDHRRAVELTLMKSVTPNLVVGLHDSLAWSSAVQGGYPSSRAYWAVPTTHMETDFSATDNAWLYSEIWRAKQNSDGSFVKDPIQGMGTEQLVEDLSVQVTGAGTGSGTTLTEQQWNGEIPMFTETSRPQKYLITYYWMLKDGRYRTDTKTVTVKPGCFDLTIDVYDAATDQPEEDALILASAQDIGFDTGYEYPDDPSSHEETTELPYTTNAAAAWSKTSDAVRITRAKLEFLDHDGTVRGQAELSGNISAGQEFAVPITYRYITRTWDSAVQAQREIVSSQKLTVVYSIVADEDGGCCVRFNKLANAPDYEDVLARLVGSPDGIPADAEAYINDMMNDVHLTLWVRYGGEEFAFYKTDRYGNPLAGAHFALYSCKDGHTAADEHSPLAADESGNCWDVDQPYAEATSAADGLVDFGELASGDYMLVETATLPGYQLPSGQWLLEVDAQTGNINITAHGEEMPPAFRVETDADAGDEVQLYLPNYPQLQLTLTGGPGAAPFAIGGGLLLGAASLLTIRARRRKQHATPSN
ncbi:MAG: prealbumin-like fold domain-containing protein [Coriobacteriales bacterium]|nr:prealbumin-like fold domain-containing protein [Coriobacteriales bacterium]